MGYDNKIVDLGSSKHVFIDWDLIEPGAGVIFGGAKAGSWETPYGVQISAHHPRIDSEPLIKADQPWETFFSEGVQIFKDEGRYRMYYGTVIGYVKAEWQPEPEETDWSTMLGYAESADGLNWVKPNLGIVDFNGSTKNNLSYTLGGSVFKDPSAPVDERYKLVINTYRNHKWLLLGAVSPDGLRWKLLEKPLMSDYDSDTVNVVRFDEEKGRYVGYFRRWTAADKTNNYGRRYIAYAETENFGTWPVPETIVTPDMHDGPDTDIYTNSYTPWPGANAHLMFPAFYRRTPDITEVHMMTSRDGLRWERPTRQPVITSGEPGTSGDIAHNWQCGLYAGVGLVSLRPDEVSLPIAPVFRSHNNLGNFPTGFPEGTPDPPYTGHGADFSLATWRKDGFTSLEAETEGRCTTAPFTFTGKRLEINAWTRFRGEIRVELVDNSEHTRGLNGQNQPAIDGHTFEDCDPITGNLLNHAVTWQGKSDLSGWAGKPIRLRFHMRKARLYAMQFA